MSFAHEIKQEVLSQEFAVEQAHAFVSGLIGASGIRDGSRIVVKINDSEISKILQDLIKQLEIEYDFSPENKNWIIVKNYNPTSDIKQPSYYFAGAFVGGGSISDSQSTSYHLEIQLYSHLEAQKIQNFLNKYSFEFSLIQRRKLFVLYIKKSEQIADFLRAIQAFNSLLTFEDARISRDFHNQLNRYSNLDAYNQNKLAKSSAKFMELYKVVKSKKLFNHFNERELWFFELKAHNRYSSLEELTLMYEKKYGIKKTRAGFNHWIIKLKKVVRENDK